MVFPCEFFLKDHSLCILKGSCDMPLETFFFSTYSTKKRIYFWDGHRPIADYGTDLTKNVSCTVFYVLQSYSVPLTLLVGARLACWNQPWYK